MSLFGTFQPGPGCAKVPWMSCSSSLASFSRIGLERVDSVILTIFDEVLMSFEYVGSPVVEQLGIKESYHSFVRKRVKSTSIHS